MRKGIVRGAAFFVLLAALLAGEVLPGWLGGQDAPGWARLDTSADKKTQIAKEQTQAGIEQTLAGTLEADKVEKTPNRKTQIWCELNENLPYLCRTAQAFTRVYDKKTQIWRELVTPTPKRYKTPTPTP